MAASSERERFNAVTRNESMPDYKRAVLAAACYFSEIHGHLDEEEPFLCRADRESAQWLSRAVPGTPEGWKCAAMEWQGITSEGTAAPEGLPPLSPDVLCPTASPPESVSETQLLQETFEALAERWREDTAVMSSVTQMSMHPAYQRIIGMGPKVVPLILRELEREPDHWFWALTFITGEDPVPPEDAGDIRRMTEAWLRLGRQRGLL
jgi:hypothetical protein